MSFYVPTTGNMVNDAKRNKVKMMGDTEDSTLAKFPTKFFISVLIASLLPLTLTIFGADFGLSILTVNYDFTKFGDLPRDARFDALFRLGRNALVHGLLEWTSIMVAFLAVILAFSHFVINKVLVAPIIGVALFCCGIMDTFHTLTGLRLVNVVAHSIEFIPFSWALSRGFDAIIIIAGCIFSLRSQNESGRSGMAFVGVITLVFAATAYFLIAYTVGIENLPQTQFPNAFITRPYDMMPLVLYIVAAPLFWMLYKKTPNYLTASLVIALIPYIMLEAHMVFGSSRLFDSHFNIAHALKILAYFVPFVGLTLDYVSAHRRQKEAQSQLKLSLANLQISNADLEKFAYVASHDLKSPLRAIDNLSAWISEDLDGKVDAESQENLKTLRRRVHRMESLLDGLLSYSRAGREVTDDTLVNGEALVAEITETLNVPEGFKIHSGAELKDITILRMPLEQALHNLISNALKHHDGESGNVWVNATDKGAFYEFYVKDDGPGIAPEYHDKIFEMFQTLRRRDEVEGSGMGLSLVKKIVQRQEGGIKVESEVGNGTTFRFTWPK